MGLAILVCTMPLQASVLPHSTQDPDMSGPPDPEALPLELDVQAVQALRAAGEAFLFLDCREPDEHAAARIPGTLHLPMAEIPERLDVLMAYRDRRIVVHCHHGGRSLRVTRFLRQQGFAGAQNMAGGIDAWSLEIDPTTPRY
jgi:rhodanese-related sulfurtransferase